MIPIRILEFRTERVVRAILRDVMRGVATIDDFDHAISRIDSVGWERMHDSIVANYNAGYLAAGDLVRRGLRTAAVTEGEDPRIANYTTRLIYGLEHLADNQRNELQAVLRTCYERGDTYQQVATKLERFFDGDPVAARRFARTATNDIYNRAHLDRYEQSGVADGIQYSAHLDRRTSDICRMLHRTIWGFDDPDIQTPPQHFNCRSRIIPYFGKIPGKRDFTKQFSADFIERARKTQSTFRKKYWTPFPRTKASATLQRRFFDKRDITDVNHGLTVMKRRVRAQELKIIDLQSQMTKGLTKHELAINRSLAREIAEIREKILTKYGVTSSEEFTRLMKRLKNTTDPTTIVDGSGSSVMLDKFERRLIREALEIEIARAVKDGKLIRADLLRKRLETI